MKRPRLTKDEITILLHTAGNCDTTDLDDYFPGEGAKMMHALAAAKVKLRDMLANRLGDTDEVTE